MSQENIGIEITVKRVVYIVAGLFALIVLYMSAFIVEEFERGIVKTWGKIAYVADPGLSFKIPIVQSVTFYRTDIRSQTPEKALNTYTSDNQEVDIVFTIFYRIPVENMKHVYQNAQDYDQRLFSMAIDRLKSQMGSVNLAHFAERRGEIGRKMRDTMNADAKPLGLEITDFQLTNVEYTKSFRAAVEQASSAKAMIETRENEKQQAMRQAEGAKIVAEGKANAAREAAKGEADAKWAVAQATAKSIQAEGEAKAAAMRAQAEALARNPVLVEMAKAEKWDGALPQSIYAGAPIPFMAVK